jgi:long-chain acyl-CoA synthetase
MTETASLISLNHPFRAAQGSLGKILPGREFRLARDGEIFVRGENVSPGYWQSTANDPESALPRGTPQHSTAKEAKDPGANEGWLPTGDLGELDAAGNLRFRGRKKNVIVTSAGLNIYPDDLLAVLQKQPQIRDAVVIPLRRRAASADEENQEPCAVLLLDPAEEGEEAAAARAIAAANASLADYQQIRTWLLWPGGDFPRTSTGKPRESEIAAKAAELLGAQPGSPISEPSSVRQSSRASRLGELLARYAATPSAHLEQNLNLSSLDRVELLSTLEATFHVEVSESAFAKAKTAADLERLITHPEARTAEYAYPGWAQSGPIRLLRLFVYYLLVWPATEILAHPKIVGGDHLKNVNGPALFISNHITRRADLGLILFALPPRFRHRLATAMGGETLNEMRHPPAEWFAPKRWLYQINYWLVTALFTVFPLPQFSGVRESFAFAGESADRDYNLLVFPEGIVNETPDGRMAKFQPGIGLLAENLGIPIIPMRLDGVAQMKQARRRLARRNEITVYIGAPIRVPPHAAPQEIAAQLESAVRSLG